MAARGSTAWKLEHSWWVLPIAFGFGFLTWAAFGYVALRTHLRKWWLFAAGYLVLLVISMYLLSGPGYGVKVTTGTVALLVCWIGGLVHALAVRGEVLDRISFDDDPRLATARTSVRTRRAAQDLARSNPTVAAEAGVGHGMGSLGALVDVNHATADEFATLPGFSAQLCKSIVDLRDRREGFDSVDDFATSIQLPIRLVDSIRERLVCLPRA